MKRDLIDDLVCPYCGGPFRISREVEGDTERLRYALLQCRCFEFPIVDGILLLSLAKGYGGSEERLQPYVPLLVAAIRYLSKDDVDGLRAWIRRHMRFVDELMSGGSPSYLEFRARMWPDSEEAVARELAEYARYEVVGARPRTGFRNHARALWRRNRTGTAEAAPIPPTAQWLLRDYYASRFLSPRIGTLALQLERLPMRSRILSLCCGHGIFENLLEIQARRASVVSVDAQLINLLLTRRFVSDAGAFICHDVQFPLPFRTGYFGGVFSSTCLPEIPSQRVFAMESLRVTAESGWCFFDQIWGVQPPAVERINRLRHYRFCQNFFQDLTEYLPFFTECAPGRRLLVDVPDVTAEYLQEDHWLIDHDAARSALREGRDVTMSVLAVSERRFEGFDEPDRRWMDGERLRVSPIFEVAPSPDANGCHRLRLRVEQTWAHNFAAKRFGGYPTETSIDTRKLDDASYVTRLFCDAIAVPLRGPFDPSIPSLARLKDSAVGRRS